MKFFASISLVIFFCEAFSQDHKINLCFDTDLEFTYAVESNLPNTTFYWYLDGILQFGQNLTVSWVELPIGHHTLSVYGVSNNCVSEMLTYHVLVEECSTIFIPNAFTPDADGKNDLWYPVGVGWEWIEVSVFDRWGLLVFESDRIDGFWDGSFRNGEYYVQNDVYVYKVNWKGTGKKAEVIFGHVVLIR